MFVARPLLCQRASLRAVHFHTSSLGRGGSETHSHRSHSIKAFESSSKGQPQAQSQECLGKYLGVMSQKFVALFSKSGFAHHDEMSGWVGWKTESIVASVRVCELAGAAMRGLVVLVAIPALLPRSRPLTHAYPEPASHHGKRCKSLAVFFQSFKFTRRIVEFSEPFVSSSVSSFPRKIHAESLFCSVGGHIYTRTHMPRYGGKCSIRQSQPD